MLRGTGTSEAASDAVVAIDAVATADVVVATGTVMTDVVANETREAAMTSGETARAVDGTTNSKEATTESKTPEGWSPQEMDDVMSVDIEGPGEGLIAASPLARRSPRLQDRAQPSPPVLDNRQVDMTAVSQNVRSSRSKTNKRRAEAARRQLESIFNSDSDEEEAGAISSSVDESSGSPDDRSEHTDAAGESRSGPSIVQILDKPIAVTQPAVYHDDWSAWMSNLEAYQESTMQVIRVQEVVRCDNRNKRLSQTKAAKRGEAVQLVPEEWDVYQRTYICTHGWQPKNRGEGKRPPSSHAFYRLSVSLRGATLQGR